MAYSLVSIYVVAVFCTTAFAGYAGSGSSNNDVAGGTSYGYGYGGSGAAGAGGQHIPFDFNNFLAGLNQLQNAQAQAAGYAGGYGFPGGFPAFQGFPTGAFGPGGVGGFPSGAGAFSGGIAPPSNGGYGAGASASIGGGNVEQSAYLSPENPASPNVNTRFAETGAHGDAPGTYSVFTSSSSGSGNVDGKPVHFREAQTTVNDNGKVSTYTVRDKK